MPRRIHPFVAAPPADRGPSADRLVFAVSIMFSLASALGVKKMAFGSSDELLFRLRRTFGNGGVGRRAIGRSLFGRGLLGRSGWPRA